MADRIFTPRFKMDHDLPVGSFWRHMQYNGKGADVYFFKDGPRDSYMCRYSDVNEDYSSGCCSHLPHTVAFMDSTPLEAQIKHYREIIHLTQAYLEWKGINECPEQGLRDKYKEQREAKERELMPKYDYS
jgi:hypothetical protein